MKKPRKKNPAVAEAEMITRGERPSGCLGPAAIVILTGMILSLVLIIILTYLSVKHGVRK